MVFYKNFLEVNKKDEPEKYHILHDLEIYGKSVIENVDKKSWWTPISIEIGHASKRITDSDKKRLLLPPMRNDNKEFAVIMPNINVVVREEKITDIKSRFFFVRKF